MLEKYGLNPTNAKAVSVGDRFERLEVIGVGQNGRFRYYAVCKCDCGNEKLIRFDGLISGAVRSCGCLHHEIITTHHLSKSPHYPRWRNMIDRCENPECKSYKRYGARGISVCERWHDVEKFISDLPDGFKDGMQLDRIDNNGNYEPGNVRWVTPKKNCSNRCSTKLITYNGETKTSKEWSIQLGGSHWLVRQRIENFGWSIEKAITTPLCDTVENMRAAQKKRWEGHTKRPAPKPPVIRTVEYNGKLYTANEIADMAGKPVKLIRKQLYERGWSVEKVLSKQ